MGDSLDQRIWEGRLGKPDVGKEGDVQPNEKSPEGCGW